MKRLIKTILTCGALAAGLSQAGAVATMRLSGDGGATWVVVVDNGPLDSNPTAGFISYSGVVGDWYANAATGIGSPLVGSPSQPKMDVGSSSLSANAAALIVQMSDTGFVGVPNQTFISTIGGQTDGTVNFNTYRDLGNVLFGTTEIYPTDPVGTSPSPTSSPLSIQGPFTGSVDGFFGSNAVTVATAATPYSLTLEEIIVHTAAGDSQIDGRLTSLAPPPCNCTVTFNAPQSITNCAGDTIPDVTATQDCGAGPLSVPVVFVSATTNGTCPQIITRNFTATDACGNPVPFTQTITVNCRGNICGHVFADCDGNGDLTAGDVGIAKITVTLLDSSKHVLGTTVTDANGGYCFTNLAGGDYVVTINPPSGYCQTAASTSYHWKDCYGRTCWQENDGYIHCLSSGTECWWDKNNTCHWKDSYNRDCWKDNWGVTRCQPLCYKSCNGPTNSNCISVTLTNCTSLTDVDFAYTGTKPCLAVSCSGPSYVKCGQSYTYTCTVTNTGNVCFKGGNVCTTVGNCNYWGGWNNCNSYNGNCPPLSPGQSCKFTVKCSFNSWNCGTVSCQSQVNCNHNFGTCSGQSTCYSQCGW